MPELVFMAWNIENFGATKYRTSNGGPELISLIAKVMALNRVSIAGFSEMRGNRAEQIGRDLVSVLDGLTSANRWKSQASKQFVAGRLEQYLFVWDSQEVTPAVTPHSDAFQYEFATALGSTTKIGFPRLSSLDRPPYLGKFRTVAAPIIDIPTAVFHAPAPGNNVHAACQRLAAVSEFKQNAEACVVMGDFNVKTNANQQAPHSNGQAEFSALVQEGFQQLLVPNNAITDVKTSLVARKSSSPAMTADDCRSQPYDHIFLRKPTRNPPTTITVSADGMADLITDCLPGNYLESYLVNLQTVREGGPQPAYRSIAEAFVPFRRYVSDHLPVRFKLEWT